MEVNLGTLVGILVWVIIMRLFRNVFFRAVVQMVNEDKKAHDVALMKYKYNTQKKAPE